MKRHLETTYDQSISAIKCVACGATYLDRYDLAKDDYAHGGDHNAVTTIKDTDDYLETNPLQTRGGFTEIGLYCTCGQAQRLVVANHKGAEYIGLYPVVQKV